MIRKAVGAIVFWQDQILLVEKVKRSDVLSGAEDIKGEWDLPKGGVQATDASLEQAVLRELEEETGSTQYRIQTEYPEPISFTFPEAVQEKIGFSSQRTFLFLVQYDGDGSDLKPQDAEIRQLKFVPKSEVLTKLSHPETATFLQKYLFNLNND